MPVMETTVDGKPAYKYGESGKPYTYTAGDEEGRKEAKRKAILQGVAIGEGKLEKADYNELVSYLELEIEPETMVKDDSHNCLFGWGYVAKKRNGEQVYDHSTEFIKEEDYEDLELGMYAYNLEFRASDIGHVEKQTGYLIESFVVTKDKLQKMGLAEDALPMGIWCGFYFPDDNDYATIKKMKHPMFSLFGKATREFIIEEDK